MPTSGLLFGYKHLIYAKAQIIGRLTYRREQGWQYERAKTAPPDEEVQPTNATIFKRANYTLIRKKARAVQDGVIARARELTTRGGWLVGFSGGKDSLVVAAMVRSVIPSATIVHLRDPTTLPDNDNYVELARQTLFPDMVILERPGDFWKFCKVYGFPSVYARWCCKLYRFAPIARLVADRRATGVATVVDFLGTRAMESKRRATYQHIEQAETALIPDRICIHPILDWSNLDVWAFILAHELPVNPLYRNGWRRVSCWACPFLSTRSEGLLRYVYPERYATLYTHLFDFARSMGKDNRWVLDDKWKTRSNRQRRKIIAQATPCSFQPNVHSVRLSAKATVRFMEFAKVLGPLVELRASEKTIESTNGEMLLKFQFSGDDGMVTVIGGERSELRKLQKLALKALNCTGCGLCLANCRRQAYKVNPQLGHLVFDQKRCTFCFECFKTRKHDYTYGCHNLAMLPITSQIDFDGGEARYGYLKSS